MNIVSVDDAADKLGAFRIAVAGMLAAAIAAAVIWSRLAALHQSGFRVLNEVAALQSENLTGAIFIDQFNMLGIDDVDLPRPRDRAARHRPGRSHANSFATADQETLARNAHLSLVFPAEPPKAHCLQWLDP